MVLHTDPGLGQPVDIERRFRTVIRCARGKSPFSAPLLASANLRIIRHMLVATSATVSSSRSDGMAGTGATGGPDSRGGGSGGSRLWRRDSDLRREPPLSRPLAKNWTFDAPVDPFPQSSARVAAQAAADIDERPGRAQPAGP